MNDRERREWYKAHGICIACGQADAWNGRQKCAACLEKATINNMKYYSLERERTYYARRKEKRKQRIAAGLCSICGKPQYHGQLCYECYLKRLKKNEREKAERKRRGNPKEMRVKNGMCWFCETPALPGYKVCENHYRKMDIMRAQRKDENHPWKKDEDARRAGIKKNGD